MNLFGRGTFATRLGFLAVQGALVVVVYLLARRYVGRWLAVLFAAPIATIASSEFQFHFAWSVLLILWGVWLIQPQDDSKNGNARVAIGSFLIGMSFWGRYEFAPFAAALVVLTWLWLRPRLADGGWWILVAGLAPIGFFAIYLVGIVGMERVSLDLVEYPSRFYSRPYCRGLPPVWGPAWEALTAPFRGRFWTTYDTVLGLGTFGPPITAGVIAGVGLTRARFREARSLAMVLVGATGLFVWLELRVRAGAAAEPVWAPFMVSLAAVVSLFSRSRIRALIAGIPGALIVMTILFSWGPTTLPSWTHWPPYDPLYGFANLRETFLFDREKWDRLVGVVQRHSKQGDQVFVALTNNQGHFANMSVFYWLVDRSPGSRYIGLAPCLTDTERVQRAIVQDLNDTNIVIQTPYFLADPPPFAGPASVLDNYFARNFEVIHRDTILNPDDVLVLLRREQSQ